MVPQTYTDTRAFESKSAAADEGRDNAKRYDSADNPCQTGSDEECTQWLHERLTACYND